MSSFLKWILSVFLLATMGVCTSVDAAHIVGGDMTYRFLSFNADSSEVTYEILVTMYRDVGGGGADFDSPPNTAFGVWRELAQGGWVLQENIQGIDFIGRRDVPPNDDPCVEEPVDEVIVEQASYVFEITVDVGNSNYLVSYQRCCRNCLLYTSPSPRDKRQSRMPSSA